MVEEEFLGNLFRLVEKGKSKNNAIEFSEIDGFCKEAKLTGDQMDLVYQYLEDNKIDVIQTSEEPELAFINDTDLLVDDSLLLEPTDDELEEEEENIDLDAIDLLDGVGSICPCRTAWGSRIRSECI